MKCIVCRGSFWTYLFPARDRMFGIPGAFKEYCCKQCGLVRLYPYPSSRELTKYYPSARYYSYSSSAKPTFFGRLRAFFIAREFFWLVPAMPQRGVRGKILDIGCGSGETLSQLTSIGWDAYGMDVDNQAIKIAHTRGLKNVSLGSYIDMRKYPDNFFDAIRLYHVIEHLDNPQYCIRLAYKKLKKGGELIMGTPNAKSLLAKIAGRYWMNLDAPRHLYLFTPETISVLLKRSGFGKIRASFYSVAGWAGSLQYWMAEALGRNVDLINRTWLILLFYPFEWILDRIGLGDVFLVRAEK